MCGQCTVSCSFAPPHRAQTEAADRFDQLLALLRVATAGSDRPHQGLGKRADDAGSRGVQRLLRKLPGRHAFGKQLAKHLTEQAAAADALGVDLALHRLGDEGVCQRRPGQRPSYEGGDRATQALGCAGLGGGDGTQDGHFTLHRLA